MGSVQGKKNWRDGETKVERDIVEEFIHEREEIIDRLSKYYPPDGGGRATDCRTQILFAKKYGYTYVTSGKVPE